MSRGRDRKTYKYASTALDVASRYKEAETPTSKKATKIAGAFRRIYKSTLGANS